MAGSFREAEHTGWMARAAGYDTLFTSITDQAIGPILSSLGDLRGRTLLDVCCGPGNLAAEAKARGASATGIDFAETMVALATSKHPGVPFRVGDAERLPVPESAVDHVVCAFGLMHLERPDVAIAEAFRVLRPGGTYAFTQWAADDDLLRVVSDAVAAHGSADVQLPPAPPLMRFSDPNECRRTLQAHGFGAVRVGRLELSWRAQRPELVLELIYSGAVRAAMLLEAQPADRRARIHEAIVAAVSAGSESEGVVLHRPVLLATGTRPPGP
jgi:SAM-dependent methyltransferase